MKRSGYTLIEMLVAITLTLVLMSGVVQLFAKVSEGIGNSRATLEMSESLRGAAVLLRSDLQGITVKMSSPRPADAADGYFEYVEGPIGMVYNPPDWVRDLDAGVPDTTVGDIDDVLMFTTRNREHPFVGLVGGNVTTSTEAEVAWFLRGRTLYRRVLLVKPDAPVGGNAAGFYANNDLSVRNDNGTLIANSLAGLALRRNRYAHMAPQNPLGEYQYEVRGWGPLGLPLLQECSHTNWTPGAMNPDTPGLMAGIRVKDTQDQKMDFDLWRNPLALYGDTSYRTLAVDQATGCLTGYQGPRVAEDVVLQNVIGFDVKAWDPGAPVVRHPAAAGLVLTPGDPGYQAALVPANIVDYGAYVNLNYQGADWQNSAFAGPGKPPAATFGTSVARCYDTWSARYEAGMTGSDGFDNNGDGIVDDPGEAVCSPPYPVPLRGIQVKIRTFEPTSRQIRELTIVQEFVTK